MLKIGISLLSRHRPGVENTTITSARVDPEAPPAIFRRLRRTGLTASRPKAPVAELVDALDSKSSSARSAGSIPARGTTLRPRGLRVAQPRRCRRSVPGTARRATGQSERHRPSIGCIFRMTSYVPNSDVLSFLSAIDPPHREAVAAVRK